MLISDWSSDVCYSDLVPVRVVAVLDPALNNNQRSTRTSAQQEDEEGTAMSRHVYSVTEIYGSSPDSLDDAIRNAVGTASHSLRNLEWFEVTAIRGPTYGEKISHFPVGVTLGFRYEKRALAAKSFVRTGGSAASRVRRRRTSAW